MLSRILLDGLVVMLWIADAGGVLFLVFIAWLLWTSR